MGLRVRDLTPQQAAQVGYTPHGAGAVTIITDVAPGSSADRASLKAGDVIVECDGKAIPTAADVQKAATGWPASSSGCSGAARRSTQRFNK